MHSSSDFSLQCTITFFQYALRGDLGTYLYLMTDGDETGVSTLFPPLSPSTKRFVSCEPCVVLWCSGELLGHHALDRRYRKVGIMNDRTDDETSLVNLETLRFGTTVSSFMTRFGIG